MVLLKKTLKPPPDNPGNLAGRRYEDLVLARQIVLATHRENPLSNEQLTKKTQSEFEKLQLLRAERRKKLSEPPPPRPAGPLSFFTFAREREVRR